MQNQTSITIWLAFSIILLSAGLVSHVMMIPVILDVSKRDSWISVIIAAPFFVLWLMIIYWIIKSLKGKRLTDWMSETIGKPFSVMFRLVCVLFIFSSSAYTLHDTTIWTVTTYMQNTPFIVLVAFLVILACITAMFDLKNIAMTASILLPFVLILGYFVMGANTKYKDYSLMKPFLEFGWSPVFHGTLFVLSSLMEVWIILLFHHEIKSQLKWWHVLLLAIFLLCMSFGPTISAIVEFGPEEASRQRYTAFEQWKLVRIGLLLQHVDFLSIYQWLSGAFIRVAIGMFLIVDMFKFPSKKASRIAIAIVALLMMCLNTYPWRDDKALDFVRHVYSPSLFIFVCVTTIFVAIVLFFQRNKKTNATNKESSS